MNNRHEFESEREVLDYLQTSTDLTGCIFQSIHLDSIEQQLAEATLVDNVLLGCTARHSVLDLFSSPLVFPQIPDLPFNPFRAELYTPIELLGDYTIGQSGSYEQTVDGKVYQHYLDTGKASAHDVVVTLTRRLHDHAITDALKEFIAGKKVVAIMGGHSMRRDDPVYLEVARLSRDLVHAGYLPVSGGGPGAMEASHLGAWFAERPDRELMQGVNLLAEAPLYRPIDRWMDTAFEVTEKYPIPERQPNSLGIPTWLYGHEPPTCFAESIAKYFANSVREEGLLAIATYGVVFAPGSAGTIQEIFQDATQNHYKSFGVASPMLFLGQAYWKWKQPIYGVLTQLAAGRDYASLISITDSRAEILQRISAFDKSFSAV